MAYCPHCNCENSLIVNIDDNKAKNFFSNIYLSLLGGAVGAVMVGANSGREGHYVITKDRVESEYDHQNRQAWNMAKSFASLPVGSLQANYHCSGCGEHIKRPSCRTKEEYEKESKSLFRFFNRKVIFTNGDKTKKLRFGVNFFAALFPFYPLSHGMIKHSLLWMGPSIIVAPIAIPIQMITINKNLHMRYFKKGFYPVDTVDIRLKGESLLEENSAQLAA